MSDENNQRFLSYLAEHHRRSLGQIVRWQEWRMAR